MSPEMLFFITLVIKMTIAALFVIAATVTAERAGAVVGALVATLPISAGPAYVFLALDHDAAFIAQGKVMERSLKAGDELALALARARVFGEEFTNVLAVGEESGRIAEVMEHQAEYYEEEAGRRLGIALAPVVAALNLAEVVLSGPAHLLDGRLAATAVATLRSRTLDELHGDLVVRMSALGQDIVMRGAAAMVLSGRLGVT